MRKFSDLLNRLLVVAVALGFVALVVTGRTAVGRAYDYREMTAAKSLHQLSQETRAGADEGDRGAVLLLGAGLFAMGVLVFGVSIFAMTGGRAFGRRRPKRRVAGRTASTAADAPQTLPALRVLPRAPYLPTLPQLPEGPHEDDTR